MSAQPVITIVLEGKTLNFGANSNLIRQLPRDTKVKIAETLLKLVFPELSDQRMIWTPQ